jgi:hypothetical protein
MTVQVQVFAKVAPPSRGNSQMAPMPRVHLPAGVKTGPEMIWESISGLNGPSPNRPSRGGFRPCSARYESSKATTHFTCAEFPVIRHY